MVIPLRMNALFMLMLSVLPAVGTAQEESDSLRHVWRSGEADATTYNALIWAYVFNQPDSAIFFGNRGMEWCEEHRDDSLLASIHNRIGVAYDIRSTSDSALYHYGIALREAKKKGNRKTEGGALNNIGLIYWNKGEAEQAIDHYIRSAEIFEQIDNHLGLGNTYNNIALILYEDDEFEKSRLYNHRALKIRKDIDHSYGIAASCTNLAQLYTTDELLLLDSAIHYLSLAIPLKLKLNDLYGLARSYHHLGDIYKTTEQYDSSLVYHSKALRIQLELGNTEGYASTYFNIAMVYYNMGDDRTELAYLDTAETHARANNDNALLWRVFRTKARVLGRSGSVAEAHQYWLQYDHLKDSIVTLERSRQVEELETRYRTAEKDREIAEQESALTRSQLDIEGRNKWIAGLLGGLISLILLGIALRQIAIRKAQAEKDAAIISERERGLEAIITATEDERKRIAKDLHDGIVQTLTGLNLRLQKQFTSLRTEDEKLQTEFSHSQSILNEAIGEVRGISHRMMPRVLSETGLIPAIEDMLGKSLGSTDIKYEFEHHKVDGKRFKENMEISLYRICQELINNIIKHSGAKAVSIQLLRTDSHLILMVEDNGKGFILDDEKSRNGIGLMNITSRAKAMNGEVNYEPSPEHGTVATIRIPIT